MADKKINSAFMSLTGNHIRCMNTQSAVALNRNTANGIIEDNSITQRDINRVLELTQGIALPPDRDIYILFRKNSSLILLKKSIIL